MHVSVTEVLDLLQGLTNDKATGMDGLSGESLKFADFMLALLLSICFTCMFKHSYLPVSMLHSVVVRLEKNKNGDLSDKNNYNDNDNDNEIDLFRHHNGNNTNIKVI